MDSDERIKSLEAEVTRLKEKEKRLEHDLGVYRQIFSHLKAQFEQLKMELLRKR